MRNQLLPQNIDNAYRGHRLALWLFALVVGVRIAQSLLVLFGGSAIVQSADGIPLETYPSAAAQTVVALSALAALSRLFVFVLCGLTLLRYRSAIALMFALLLLNYVAGQVVVRLVPIVRTGTPPGPAVNLVLFAMMIVGFALSLWHRGDESASGVASR